MTIRRAQLSDMDALIDLADRFYKTDGYSTDLSAIPDRLQSVADSPNTSVFVAEAADLGVIGFCLTLLSEGLEFGRKAEIEALFVRNKVRGQRIGTRLLEASSQWAHEAGANTLFLVIAAQGEPVRQLEQLYLGVGFEPSRRVLMYK